MIYCEHLIYTSAKTTEKVGYQIIAKSEGITNDLVSEISGYLYPIGIDTEIFNESRSLLLLSKNKIAYSIVKNIGIGHDLRKGTLYNHTFILDRKDFSKLDNNSKIFDSYFIKNSLLTGTLSKLSIQQEPSKIDFDFLNKVDEATLSEIIYSLIIKKKLAIVGTFDFHFIQNLLLLLPPSLRLMSFASIVFEPSRQTEYEIIQIPRERVDQVESKYALVDISDKFRFVNTRSQKYHEDVQYLIRLIKNRKSDEILDYHKRFEAIQRLPPIEKFRLLNYELLVDITTDNKKKAEYLIECAKITRKIDAELTDAFMYKAERLGEAISDNKLLSQIRLGRLLQNMENNSLSLAILEKILDNADNFDHHTKKQILGLIISAKKDDVSRSYFLRDLLRSESPNKTIILEVILDNKELGKLVVEHVINGAYDENTKFQMIDDLLIIAKDNYDVLKVILEYFEAVLDSEHKFANARIFNLIYSNHNFRDSADPKLIVKVNDKIISYVQKMIKNNTVKLKSKKIEWRSVDDFHVIRHSIFDLFQNLIGCLNYIKDYRQKDITTEQHRKIMIQIDQIEKLLSKIQLIRYVKVEKPTPVFNPMKFFFWWLPQNDEN